MAQSSEISPEDPIVYTQYNNLRDDVLSTTLGHTHSGASSDGKRISVADKLNVGAGVSGAVDGEIFFSTRLKRTSDNAYPFMCDQGEYRVEVHAYLLNITGGTPAGDWEDASHSFTFDSAFTAEVYVFATVAEVNYIRDISNVRVSSVTTSGCTVECDWQSDQSSVTNTIRFYLLAIGD